MIDTIHLMPPDLGPRSNPVLFGIAEAMAELFPPVMPAPRLGRGGSRDHRELQAPYSSVDDAAALDVSASLPHRPAGASAA